MSRRYRVGIREESGDLGIVDVTVNKCGPGSAGLG
jgi:hypothetical protein